MRILMFVGISVFAAGPVLCQVAYERPVPEQIAGPAGKIWSERKTASCGSGAASRSAGR
jgi:hypothetical protein